MKKKTPKNKIGKLFEEFFSKKFKIKLQPGSGNGIFAKLDAADIKFLYSLKATSFESFRLTLEDIREVEDEVYKPGGIGIDRIPAMIISFVRGEKPADDDSTYILMRFDELYHLLKEKPEIYKSTKKDNKYETARVPSLFRRKEESE